MPGKQFPGILKLIIMNKLFAIVLVAFGFSGCNNIVLKVYGVKNPDFESTISIEKFKNEVFGNEFPFFVVAFSEWKNNQLFTIPDVFVFSNDGKYIPYKDSLRPNCNGPAEIFLAELDKNKHYNYGPEYSLDVFLRKLQMPCCIKTAELESDQKDFYIFITWANWAGKKLCREKTIEWLKALETNTKISYKLILVNQDLQECWSDEQKKQLESQTGSNH